jgi:primosomal protein N' (replication factor Y)
VLVICPTVRMAIAGAAALRRRGLTTALMPDDWDDARAGVDVVIGTRSGVFAPVDRLSSVVVIDEHDESLHEERAPTWDAMAVARERARVASVPFYVTSPVPSAASLFAFSDATQWVRSDREWPQIYVTDLNDIPVNGSLLSSEMLHSVSDVSRSTVCVLNTKGKARLIVCKSCREVQRCSECLSLLTQDDEGALHCVRCTKSSGSVCQKCGRASFVVPRGGVSQLRQQLEANSASEIVEITSDSDDSWTAGRVFIGTEAVLYRVPSADTVVFADIDRDLGAPRMTAGSEVLALVARAARIVGANGRIIIQTRQPDHPLMKVLASPSVADGIRDAVESDLARRVGLGLPPASRVVRVTLPKGYEIADGVVSRDVLVAHEEESVLLRSASNSSLSDSLQRMRDVFGTQMRVYADPRRF